MTRTFRWILLSPVILGVILLILLGVLWTLSRAVTPNQAQREALVTLETPVAVSGRNAFPRLWLLEYDIPEAELDAVVRADARRLRELLDADAGDLAPQLPQESVASGRYPRIAAEEGDVRYCGLRDGDCLQHVRGHREAVSARLRREAVLLQRVRSLNAYGHYLNGLPPAVNAPLPRFQNLAISHTQSALDFAEGRVEPALTAVCEDVVTWRRLIQRSNSLVFAMIGMSLIDADSRLFAQMLAELPLERPLPAACANAFDPALIPSDMCMALQGEAALSFATFDRMAQMPNRWSERVIYALGMSASRTKARFAVAYAPVCTEAVRKQLAADLPIDFGSTIDGGRWDDLECIGNLAGCMIADAAIPAYRKYLLREQDIQAMLRVVDTTLWLRGHAPDRTLRPDFVRRVLAERASTLRAIAFDEAAMNLEIDLRDASKANSWLAPLPSSRMALPAAGAGPRRF